jgi:multidrug efflux pump
MDATLKTAAQRARPILLTTVTTIAGLIPMATQINFDFFDRVIQVKSITSMWWVQLSTAVISGLAFSTILTLVFIPVMLNLPSVWRKAGRKHWQGWRKHWESASFFHYKALPKQSQSGSLTK